MDYLLNSEAYSSPFFMIHTVLNLIINGLPSKLRYFKFRRRNSQAFVLNLIINGLPSKHKEDYSSIFI